jgi:serine/threonine protein kinase
MRDDDRFDALVRSISDDAMVDWDAGASRGGGSESAVRALRDVARIVAFNRELQRSPDHDALSSTPDASQSLERWGELTLLEPLGSGGSGEVWRAWDAKLRREVALKFLKTRISSGASSAATGAAGSASPGDARLFDEARALARIRHPGVVTVHGIAEHEGRTGMWMEQLRGATLAEAIERGGALPPSEVVRIGLDLSRALEAVDAAGLVHRDLKPSNVVLEESGRVVLTDFGLGRDRRLGDSEGPCISGTPVFMAPEILGGAPATVRSDLYALGVTLRWALTGRVPFAARTIEELKAEAKAGPATSLATERPEGPQALITAIEHAMSPEPQSRFSSASAMKSALEEVLAQIGGAGHARVRAPRRLPIAAVILVGVAAATWVVLRNGAPSRDSAARSDASSAVATSESSPGTAALSVVSSFDVEAALVDRSDGSYRRLAAGDQIAPGDQLSLEFRGSKPTWVYVLNQDERGEMFLLFPQPLFDLTNPLAPDSAVILPGPIDGRENGWTVTSRGGREHFLVVASLSPVAEIESELARLPAATPDREIRYASIPPAAVQRLRGVGGVSPLPDDAVRGSAGPFERFQALAGRETVSESIWVRRITLENPLR